MVPVALSETDAPCVGLKVMVTVAWIAPWVPASSLAALGVGVRVKAALDSGRETRWSSARGSSAPGPSVAPTRGGCVGGVRFEQAYAHEPPILMDALDRVSAELELAQDGGREVDPAGSQVCERDRPVPGAAQSL